MYVGASEGQEGRVAVFSEAGSSLAMWTGADTLNHSFDFLNQEGKAANGISDVAVNNSLGLDKGDVYVADTVADTGQVVVDVFKPEAGGKEPSNPKDVTQLRGTCETVETTCPGKEIPFEVATSAFPLHVAVDESTGDVLVVDDGAGSNKVVDVFKPEPLGVYEFVRQIKGPPPGDSFGGRLLNLAVDPSSGDIYVAERVEAEGQLLNEGFVDQFSATGEYLGRITGGNTPGGDLRIPQSVAVNPALPDDVYVGDHREGNGSLQRSVVDAFGPDIVIPDVTVTEPVSSFQIEPATHTWSATLKGTVNPVEGAGAATCEFEYGTSASYGKRAPCSAGVAPGNAPVPVESKSGSVTGLLPDTIYYYRLDATNIADGQTNTGEGKEDEGSFTTPGPGIHSESVSKVANTSATLEATINPDGAPTSYYFQYVEEARYDASAPDPYAAGGSVPAPPGEAIGSGTGDVEVKPRQVGELLPDTVYHYRVVADSDPTTGKSEEFAGEDQMFTTQGAGRAAVLPDGRQWEMVSPQDKHGALIEPDAPIDAAEHVTQASADGSAMTYTTDAPTESEPAGFTNLAQVLSTRGPDGWSSRDISSANSAPTGLAVEGQEYRFFSEDLSLAVVQPLGSFTRFSPQASEQTSYLQSDFAPGSGGTPCTESCNQPLVSGCPPLGETCRPVVEEHANVARGTVFGEEGRCPSEIPQCGPRFLDATPDGSHIVLTSGVPLTEATETTPAATNGDLYEWAGGKLTLVSVLPNGKEAVGGVEADLGHNDHVLGHAISDDGSHIVWGEHGGSLYMRDTARGETVQLDAPEPECLSKHECESGGSNAEFQSASNDGSKVFFIDGQKLTKDSGGGLTEWATCMSVTWSSRKQSSGAAFPT